MTGFVSESLLEASTDDVLLTDAGLETVLIFEYGLDLPGFAAFPLLDDPAGRAVLAGYFRDHLQLAAERGTGFILETPTWRANPGWGAALGYGPEDLRRINQDAVAFGRGLTEPHGGRALVSGCLGPRGDGCLPGRQMSPAEAFDHHRHQIGDLADAGADLVTTFTFSYSDEAVGAASAASAAGIPLVVGFTVEADGRLPSGEDLGTAIERVDHLTGGYPAWFMVNCAHPDHIAAGIRSGAAWTRRVGALRANASRLSHAELEATDTLDAGDPDDLARGYLALQRVLPQVRVIGGCCGTDIRHVTAISRAWTATPPPSGHTG